MEDSIFLRTRSQAPLPEASIDISRSPLKDARIASRSKASAAAEGIGSEEKDNAVVDGLEYSRKKLGDKRSPSPSNSDRFRLTKRFKSSPTGHNVAPSLAHARHLSDSSIFPKRSAVTSKPNSSSQSSTRHQSPTLPTKERAKSVPIFHSFRDFPVIDIRDIPTSPTRRTPKWEKLRITSTQKKLETIPDVPAESTPAKTTVPLRVSLEVTAIEPATPTFAKTIGMPANVILSPLTPLPETPRLQKLSGTADDAQDRFNAIRWGQDLLRPEEPLFVESTTAVKPPPVRNLRSRLPRPTNATASSLKARPESIAEKAAGTTPAITAPKQNAFDILMKKDQHRKGKGKAVEKPRAAALGGKAKFEASQTGEETKVKFPKAGSSKASTIKGKMKPRTKAQPQGKVPLIFDDEEEERPVEPLNEEVVYPLESLPTRDSLSPPNPPPRTSSPIFTPDVEDIRMTGVDDGILRMDNVGMDDVEMKAEDERVPEQDSTFPMEVESSVLIPEEAFQEAGPDIVPQVPSPLFTEVPSAAPSPLFSEPEFLDGKNPRDDPSPQNKPVETINASHNESTEVAADPLPSPPVDSSPRRTKASRLPPAPRATRSASSKMPTVEIPAPVTPKTAAKRGKKVKPSPQARGATVSTADPSSSSQPGPEVRSNEIAPADPSAARFNPPYALTFPGLDETDLSDLSDLPDEFSMEMPLKGDAGEDVEMSDESAPTNSPGASHKGKTSLPVPSPRRKSLRGKKSEAPTPEEVELPAAYSVRSPRQQPTEVATTSPSKARGKARKSAIPVPTPARSKSTMLRSPEKESRPNSAPSSPVKITRTYTDFSDYSYVPVSKFNRAPDPGVLERIKRLNETLDRPLPKLDLSRPNTSLGFNRDDPDSSMEFEGKSTDNILSKIGKKSTSGIGLGRPSTISNASTSQASSSKSSASTKPLTQKKLTSIFGPASSQKSGGMIMRGAGPGVRLGNRFPVTAGVGPGSLGSRGKKASQKPMLPSVQGSPVKGGAREADDTEMAEYHVLEGDITIPDVSMSENRDDMDISELEFTGASSSKAKGKARESLATTASKRPVALSQSMSALPTGSKPIVGLMGPPPPPTSTSPPRRAGLRSSSSSYPSGSRPQAPPKFVPEATFLEGCRIFVDVWMSDGQDTSALYIDIAKNMGARIVKTLGPQCTHLVFTAGRERTVEQYFALDEPKRPKAVGAAWLRDCKSLATLVDESKYIVDLEEHKPSMTSKLFNEKGEKVKQKRRQSFIPKFIEDNSDCADISMDGSNLSFMDDDDDDELTPLERARLRQSLKSTSKRK